MEQTPAGERTASYTTLSCPTCGAAVRVVGDTTYHYEPLADEELRERRACLVGAKETLEMIAATLENAEDLALLRGSLAVPVAERLALVEQAIANTDRALG